MQFEVDDVGPFLEHCKAVSVAVFSNVFIPSAIGDLKVLGSCVLIASYPLANIQWLIKVKKSSGQIMSRDGSPGQHETNKVCLYIYMYISYMCLYIYIYFFIFWIYTYIYIHIRETTTFKRTCDVSCAAVLRITRPRVVAGWVHRSRKGKARRPRASWRKLRFA